MKRVLSLAPKFECTRPLFEGIAELVQAWTQENSSFAPEELENLIRGFDACVVWLDQMAGEVIESSKSLKVIGIPRAGFDNVDIERATEKRIPVVYAPGANSVAVADYTIGLIISLLRGIVRSDRALKGKVWNERWALLSSPGRNLEGMKLGIIGLGNVGSRVAVRARAFGMEVLGVNSSINAEKQSVIGLQMRELARLVDLQTLLRESDIVSIHLPLTSRTKGLIGERELCLMKKTAYVVNVSRGGVVNERDLIRALRDKRIAGAALDVFEKEPLSLNSELLDLDNVILTPHIAWCTNESISNSNSIVASSIIKILGGGAPDPRFVANPSVLRQS
ncbi:MAG: D-glycerate dehydrogenase [Nitrososphaerota archaeon]|nr:D-glycerate dehydrogenase [Nitrososphaerota archaeon]